MSIEGTSQQAADGGAWTLCPDCGAHLSLDVARCPYCGALNPIGAEKAYMGELDGIKSETSGLVDDARGRFRTTLRSNVGKTVTIIVVVIAVLMGFFAASGYLEKSDEQRTVQEYQAREAFRMQYFGEFDRLYEAGDYDALSSYVWSLTEEPGFDALFSWKHVGFLEAHDDWEALCDAKGYIESGECTFDDYVWLVTTALRLAQLDEVDEFSSYRLSQEEEELAKDYRAYAWQFLQDTLQMDRAEVTTFAEGLKGSDGYIDKDKLEQELDARLKQIGTL